MKYNININQLVLSKTNLNLIDCAILDYLYYYCNSKNEKIEAHRKEGFTWINYKTLIDEMPLLRIKTRQSITPHIKKIAQEKFIEGKLIRTKGKRSTTKLFVKLTVKIDKLFVKLTDDSQEAVRETLPNHYTNDYYTKKNVSKADPLSKTHKEITELFDFYKALFIKRISSAPPVFNWGACVNLARPHIKTFGLSKMKKFCEYYLSNNNDKKDAEKFKNCKWSLPCFLSTNTMHRISIAVE